MSRSASCRRRRRRIRRRVGNEERQRADDLEQHGDLTRLKKWRSMRSTDTRRRRGALLLMPVAS